MRMAGMRTPAFFVAVPPIRVTDPLAALLGAADGGHIDYHYLDAVKLAGHSCPTVAGAWLMTRTALAHLYTDQTPQRGGVRVELRQAVEAYTRELEAKVVELIGAAIDKLEKASKESAA